MKIGLLWWDNNPRRTLEEKIGMAARRYKQKFGSEPNVVHVHPSALSNDDRMKKVGTIHVSPDPTVLQHHFWIGREEPSKLF